MPIADVFGEVPHQSCEFHVLKELTKAVLPAVAKVRKELAAQKPKLPRGRPSSKRAKRAARRKKQTERKIGDLFEHRHLLVRRCRTDTALAKLAKLRSRVRRFKQVGKTLSKLFSLRDLQSLGRSLSTKSLHQVRAG